MSIWYSYRMICLVLFSWACRLSFLAFYLAQAFKILTKKHELHYCSAFIEVRSGGTIGANAITWSRPITIDEFHSPKKGFRRRVCIQNTKFPHVSVMVQKLKGSSFDKLTRCHVKMQPRDKRVTSMGLVGCFEDKRRFSDLSAISRLGSRRFVLQYIVIYLSSNTPYRNYDLSVQVCI